MKKKSKIYLKSNYKKNIAVIGCGYWGKNIIRNFFELGALHSICDSDYSTSRAFAKKYNVKNCSFIEILNDPNIKGVVLAVPAQFHASMAVDIMNKEKHVFVEKPLAMNEIEGKQMVATAKKNNVKLMVGHLLQYHPIFKSIREMVAKGDIGKLNYIFSNRLSLGKVRTNEDVIWSFAPHDISMILSLAGQNPESVSATSTSVLQKNLADTATVHMKFKSGLKSDIRVSWLNPYKEVKLVISGKSGMIVFDDNKPWSEKLLLYLYKKKLSSNGIIDIKKISEKYIEVEEEEPLRNECQHFVSVVEGNLKPYTNGVEGLKVLKVLSATSLAHEKNEVVKL